MGVSAHCRSSSTSRTRLRRPAFSRRSTTAVCRRSRSVSGSGVGGRSGRSRLRGQSSSAPAALAPHERGERLDDCAVGRPHDWVAGAVEDECPLCRRFACELANETRLAGACLASHQHDPPAVLRRRREELSEEGEFACPADERKRRLDLQRIRQVELLRRRSSALEVERGILIRGSQSRAPSAPGSDRCLLRPPGSAWSRGRPRARRPGAPSGRGRASAARTSALSMDAPRSASPARRSARRGGRARDLRRSVRSGLPAAARSAARSRLPTRPRCACWRTAAHATAPAPP